MHSQPTLHFLSCVCAFRCIAYAVTANTHSSFLIFFHFHIRLLTSKTLLLCCIVHLPALNFHSHRRSHVYFLLIFVRFLTVSAGDSPFAAGCFRRDQPSLWNTDLLHRPCLLFTATIFSLLLTCTAFHSFSSHSYTLLSIHCFIL